jgi:glucan phosphorylase
VDLWLNNPRRGEEACGTSGMKAAMNGVLNLSILDGWFDEAYEHLGGWAIGEREPYSEDQDALHASAIYYLLENEIVPMFYERREQTPREWMKRVKQSLMYMASYDMDRFKKFVLESKLLDIFDIDNEEVEKIKTDEIALMKFGFKYMKYILMLEETFKLKEEFRKVEEQPGA